VRELTGRQRDLKEHLQVAVRSFESRKASMSAIEW
jgi:hypothetical protein